MSINRIPTKDKYGLFLGDAPNRVAPGYTMYHAGISDDFTNGVKGDGDPLLLDKNNTTVEFKLLENFFIIGGRATWEDASVKDYIDAYLMAPATIGINQAGDFTKFALGGGMNMYIPLSPGTGDWDLDLTETYTNGTALKCVPVPKEGNDGFFDYDSITNALTPNYDQEGGYNLYDFEATLFAFCRRCWGRADNGQSILESADVIGKLLYSSWFLRFQLVIDDPINTDPKCAAIVTTAVKNNV